MPMPPPMISAAIVGAAKLSWSTKPSVTPTSTSPATAAAFKSPRPDGVIPSSSTASAAATAAGTSPPFPPDGEGT